MVENSSYFKLAYLSLFLQSLLLQKYSLYEETLDTRNLLHTSTNIELDNLSQVLSLFQKTNDIEILSAISPTKWSQYQKSAQEATISSILGLHFGHYKVQTLDSILIVIRYSILNLSIKNSIPLKQQTKGLLVMLEKAPGKVLVSKLRAILLLKADFNIL